MELRKNRILLVEDDAVQRMALEILLKRHGYEVVSARETVTANDHLKTTLFDLVILDLSLPPVGKEAGFGILQDMNKDKHLTGLPVIVLTGILIKELIIEKTSKYDNVIDHIEKPIDANKLLKSIKGALGN